MNTLKTAVAAILIAGGTFGAFAFTKADKDHTNDKKADLHWFRSDGSYIGQGDASITGCPDTGAIVCARGYSQIDENDLPVGTVERTITKPQ